MTDKPILSVVGLGKLGAPLAACLANSDYYVWVTDKSANARMAVVGTTEYSHLLPEEPGLKSVLLQNQDRLESHPETSKIVGVSDITFVIVPTPSGPDGAFQLGHVLEACHDIALGLREKKDYHLIVITSTIMPGHMLDVNRELEKISGKKLGKDYGLCYMPLFIALGSVIENITNPDFVLIGESDEYAGDMLTAVMRDVIDPGNSGWYMPVRRMPWLEAELTKISVNAYVTMKISYANEIGRLCTRLGADNRKVLEAVGTDKRVGRNYLRAGTPFGGPCFPRDNKAVQAAAIDVNMLMHLPIATDAINNRAHHELLDRASGATAQGQGVAILGISYKPGTPVTTESAGLRLAEALSKREGIRVAIWDAYPQEAPEGTTYFDDIKAAINYADTVVLMHPHMEIDHHLDLSGKTVIAPWEGKWGS